jgi:rhamnosyltransferase
VTCTRTIAVVVTYLPEAERFQALLASLLAQVDQVLVVDNTPPGRGDAEYVVTAHPAYGEQLRIVRCGENVGIAAALNIGIGAAISENFDYVLLSDQDSLPDQDMAFHLKRVLEELERNGFNPACVMPCYADEVTQQRFGFQVQREGSLFYSVCNANEALPFIEVLSGITSGSLYPVAVFSAVGLMKEEYFIDHVDIEWFHRARARGFRLFGTSSAVLEHRLGED